MLSILAMGVAHPEHVVTNAFIESLGLETTAEWIEDKIGIKERRTTLPIEYIAQTKNQNTALAPGVASHTATDLGVLAAEKALKAAGISAEQVGLVVCNCCTPGTVFPSEGQKIAARIGCTQAQSYDLLTACPAFALHMDYLNGLREDTLPEYVLCVLTSVMTQRVNYCDRTDPSIWGDGAAAWIVSTKKQGKLKVIQTSFGCDPSRASAVVVDSTGYFHQDGRAVRDFSVRHTVRMIKALEEELALDWNKDIFIGHQANATMLRQITHNRLIPESNHWSNAEKFGNQAGAGAAVVLAQNWHRLVPGQRIVVAVLGAGLSWGTIVFEVI